MLERIYGTTLASLNGENRNGMIELKTEFEDDNSESISFPAEAIPKVIKFLREKE